ncbi:MAG: flagellar basal-body rod protein FlgF [Hyphomicrobiaceae bacterium]|nr:flagellar basal-body rod protein FlgF [Hyphomicrobiaceae bacterium]
MENALLIGLSRQVALRRQMDVVANNLANMNTAGYKSGSLMFEEHLMPVAEMNELTGQDRKVSFVLDTSVYRSFTEGNFEQSGNDLDVALSGDGWFVVQTPEGDRYTRNGQLKLNADGQLVSPAGYPVMGEGGPITFGPNEAGIEIATDGTISTSEGPRGRLRVVQFDNNAALKKEGETLFTTDAQPNDAEDIRVLQGVIEKSNVQPISELTRMIETVRAYTSVTQTVSQAQDLRREAIERLGTPPRG